MSILTTFTIVLLGTYVMDISFVVQFLIALVGLGVAVDYSLLVVNRWREERAHGRDNHDAVVVAMQHAGHAVVASAGTVAISLCALLVIPVPLLRSMGLGGMLIPLASTVVILTLLPALLGGIGPRVDWPQIRHEGKQSPGWTAWARMVVRWRWVAADPSPSACSPLLIVPVFGIKIGQAQTSSLASGGPTYDALVKLTDGGVPSGIVSPLEVLVERRRRGGLRRRRSSSASTQVDGIAAAMAPDNPKWRGRRHARWSRSSRPRRPSTPPRPGVVQRRRRRARRRARCRRHRRRRADRARLHRRRVQELPADAWA